MIELKTLTRVRSHHEHYTHKCNEIAVRRLYLAVPEYGTTGLREQKTAVEAIQPDAVSTTYRMSVEQSASRQDRQKQAQWHQVVAKLLRSDCPSVFETPMQRQPCSNDHQNRC